MRIIRDVETAKATLLKRSFSETAQLPPHVKERMREGFGQDLTAEEAVGQIISDVRAKGDKSLIEYAAKLDGARLSQIEVPAKQIAEAKTEVPPALLDSLQIAAGRIREFHAKQREMLPKGRIELLKGAGQVIAPLERVGVYAPGGTASYPSTVLMTAIPARAAGVNEVFLATPPQKDGRIPALTLAAAEIAQVDRVFAIGGAAAIASLAFGTTSVPKVDKICGPGNIFVMLAKKQVFGAVDIDALQGPTETIVLADDTANPKSCAADLLAQAEHDPMASAIMITTSEKMAARVSDEVEKQLSSLDRSEIARKSLEANGGIVIVGDTDEAVELVNDYAPEHLCLLVKNADAVAGKIRHSGGIFVGETSPEVLGDYVAGPSHVMPTSGTARFSSPINVLDFLKVISIVSLDEPSLRELGPHAAAIAAAEGLSAHARATQRSLD